VKNKKHYTPTQSAKLTQLRQLHADKIIFNATVEAEIRATIEQKSRDFELRESRMMNEAKALGVPKTEIGRAVGLANWSILEAKYALTADEFVGIEVPQYAFDKTGMLLTVHFYEFDSGKRFETDASIAFVPTALYPNGAWMLPGSSGELVDYLTTGATNEEFSEFDKTIQEVWNEQV